MRDPAARVARDQDTALAPRCGLRADQAIVRSLDAIQHIVRDPQADVGERMVHDARDALIEHAGNVGVFRIETFHVRNRKFIAYTVKVRRLVADQPDPVIDRKRCDRKERARRFEKDAERFGSSVRRADRGDAGCVLCAVGKIFVYAVPSAGVRP